MLSGYALYLIKILYSGTHMPEDINEQDSNGNTALMQAIMYHQTDTALELLKLTDINVNLKNNYGHTALDLAINLWNYRVVEQLLQVPSGNKINYEKIIDFIPNLQSLKTISNFLEPNPVELLNNIQTQNSILGQIYSKNKKLFLSLLNSEDATFKPAIAYLFEKPHLVQNLIQIDRKKTLSLVDELVKQYKSQNIKLTYNQIVPYITDIDILNKFIPIFEEHKDGTRIRSIDNPIIMAARGHAFRTIEYAYDHRQEEPWTRFWQQAGDEINSILEYFLMPNGPEHTKKNSEIFKYILENSDIVKNINNETISIADKYNPYKKLLLQKFSKKNPSWFRPKPTKNYVDNWFTILLQIQKVMQSITKHRKNYGQGAHNESTAAQAIDVSKDHFKTELDKRYPQYELFDDKINQANLDLRLLVLKQLIENIPTKGSKYYLGWEKLITLLKLEAYTEADNGKLRTFEQFKNIIFTKSNPIVLNAVLSGIDTENIAPETAEIIKSIRLLLSNQDNLLDPAIANAWKAIDPNGRSQQNFTNLDVKNFVLFCMLLATEDINKLVYNCINTNDLLQIMARSLADKSDSVRKKLVSIYNGTIKNYNFEELKQNVKECLLADQQLMGATVVTESVLALNDNSCTIGIITRFADNVLGPHYKYSLLHSEDALLKDNIENINKHMCVKFSYFLEQKVVKILLKRLHNKSHKITNMIFSRRQHLPPIKTLAELKQWLATIDDISRTKIFKDMFILSPSDTIENYTAMGSDPLIAELFDAFFSVTENNWYKLYIGDRTIEKYSALSSKTKDEINQDDKIKHNQFDTKYKRAQLLTECFNPHDIKTWLFNTLNEQNPNQPPFSNAEKQAIDYYCTTIAPPDQLQKIATKILGSIHSLKQSAKLPDDDKYYKNFITVLSKPPTTENAMDIMKWKKTLENNLVTSILFEYWREQNPNNKIENFSQPDLIDQIESIDNKIYDNLVKFAKVACKELIIQKKTLGNMPILYLIKNLDLKSDEDKDLRDKIVNDFRLEQRHDYKIL